MSDDEINPATLLINLSTSSDVSSSTEETLKPLPHIDRN